ncbi:MAG: PAS domain S-box protein [Archaeoglobaceae archaeon]|nr:PAS domain S-box protein [Archaeoglobaceae archaeon]MDW8117379.1 PAS domain S-box protein [Archaeoglobaceae archaeon]
MFELDPSTCKELLEKSSNGIVIIDKDFKIQYVNDVFCKFCNYGKEELLNSNALNLIYEEDIEKVKEIIERVFNGQWLFEEFRYKTKLGEVRWASGLLRPMEKDGKIYAVGNYVDITGIKDLRRELEESEAFYKGLIEGSEAPMYIVQDGRFVFLNKKCEELVGYTREELLNMNPFDLVHPEDREMVFRRYFEREQGLRDVESYSFRIVGKYRTGWFTMVTRRIIYKGEPAVYVTGFESTEIFSLYEELKRTNELLKSAVNKLKENIDAMANLVDKIRNPLSGLLGYSELFGNEKIRGKILDQVRRIDEIVSKIDQEWIKSEETISKLRELEKQLEVFNSAEK